MQINSINVIGFLFLTSLGMLSCSERELSEQELKAYILNEKNGLHQQRIKNEVTIDVVYKPSELVWKNELTEIVDAKAREELRMNFDSLNYFVLTFSRKGREIENVFVSNPAQFSSVINYLSFEMSKDVYQICESDTTHALDVIYTRTFGVSTGTSVMAVFKGNLKEQDSDVKIGFNDNMLGIGAVEFDFKSSDIKNIPPLILN